ncbi:MAG: hypothetical protein HYY62_04540 [Deltaproteobacteria bacterium]|nr:hypothetical protein [Deltaproteobacteria bacterium]
MVALVGLTLVAFPWSEKKVGIWSALVIIILIAGAFSYIALKLDTKGAEFRMKELRHFAMRNGFQLRSKPPKYLLRSLPSLPILQEGIIDKSQRWDGILEKTDAHLNRYYCDYSYDISNYDSAYISRFMTLAIYDFKQNILPSFEVEKIIFVNQYTLKNLEKEAPEKLKVFFDHQLHSFLKNTKNTKWKIEGIAVRLNLQIPFPNLSKKPIIWPSSFSTLLYKKNKESKLPTHPAHVAEYPVF